MTAASYARFIAACGYSDMYDEARIHAEALEESGHSPDGTPALIRGLLMRIDNLRVELSQLKLRETEARNELRQ